MPLSSSWIDRTLTTLYLNSWSLLKVPMISLIGPRVTEINDGLCCVRIPLKRLTKNHYGSLYISCQVTGAELPPGLLAMRLAQKHKANISIIFKEFHGAFKKRPDAHTMFRCEDGEAIEHAVLQAIETGTRQNQTVRVIATCPKTSGDAPVAEFELVLSLKMKPAEK
jgi:hypothetical protein